MATLPRRPLLAGMGTFSHSFERRCFSRVPALQAGMAQGPKPQMPRKQAMKSVKVIQQEQQQTQHMPNDMGLLEKTFIPPTSSVKLFSSSPLKYLRLQYYRLRFTAIYTFALFVQKWTSPRDRSGSWYSRQLKLHSSRIIPTALALHKQMYSSFAEGDAATLRKTCADGLYESFIGPVMRRKKGEKLSWELLKYNRRAKLVSDRAARYPADGSFVRQAVVRIDSNQKVTRPGKESLGQSGKEKRALEYLVLQKQYRNWEGGEWQVWGTVDETDLDTVKEWIKSD